MISFIIMWIIFALILWLIGLSEENSIVIGFLIVVVWKIIKGVIKKIIARDPRNERNVNKENLTYGFWNRWRH